ncbi:MAG: hypothetical protein ABJN95_10930 [Maribacter sp.]|uniref:hypothetical protein n=1 Tax=Maribacter sp. TaxID=1897614 RepID=UPI00329780B3
MRRTACTLLIGLAFALMLNAQNTPITKVELYGNWMLELSENSPDNDGLVFTKKKESAPLKKDFNITISLLEYDECLVNYDTTVTYLGKIGSLADYSWTFDKDLGIVNIYKSEKWLKEFKEKHPDEFNKFKMQDKYHEMELSLVALENERIGLEIINWE